ncbi:DNA polymerase III subunit alpha [Candidatus Gracilibacteria bacterium]|nr:DNA polymerase III subunit alpha [Candidatus Gracilibacteria bacterium]
MSFVHLHLHTHYSFLQGLGKPEAFVERAKELGMSALAITDTNNLHGVFEFYLLCKKKGIKPIIGVEVFICEQGQKYDARDAKVYSLILLAKNFNGYKNLIQLTTKAYLDGNVGSRAQIDFPLLEKYTDDVIALSGDLASEIAQHVVSGRDNSFLLERIAYYEKIFGKGNYFLEIGEHPDRGSQGAYNQRLVELSKISGVPLVGTNDVHYARADDAEAQDFLSCIGSGRRVDDPDRKTLIEGNYSLRPGEEMRELFAYAPEACENTVKIADMIDIEIPHGTPLLPVYKLNEKEEKRKLSYKEIYPQDFELLTDQEWLLRWTCFEGLNERYKFTLSEKEIAECVHKEIKTEIPKLSDLSPDDLLELPKKWRNEKKESIYASFTDDKKSIFDRLEYELAVVHLMGFDGYFVIVADFIRWARENNIPVGPGRGSAAGAIIAYLSGITNIDPLRYQLLFERFLNPARVSMPDIDIDFSDEGRGRVIEYVREKYGHDQVGQICTFGTLAARAAVKDVGRALGIPFAEMNQFAKLIPARPGITIENAIKENPDLKRTIDTNPLHNKLIKNAQKLEGTVRQLGVHACAVIIAPSPMTDFCPLQHPPKDDTAIVTQFSAYPLDGLGLLKMDFLGLRNLTIIDRALRIIENNHGVKIDIDNLPMDDQKVFDIFAKGDTTGIFQFESAGMRRYLQELVPNTFEDIIVMVSLYRPGPMLYIPTYIKRKHGKEKVKYPHESLAQILQLTQGIAVYQEQIMQIVQAFAGFSLGEADILRRAMGKKIKELMDEQKGKFIEAAIRIGHSEKLATYIFTDIIEPFAGYGFNKSHAACYSMIAYQTAYLKAYYPTDFLTALMVSDEDDSDRIVLEINEARSKGIQVLVPDVNESRRHFTYIDKTKIRFGLKAIKGVGDGPIGTILAGRETGNYTTLEDFVKKTGSDVINKKTLDALIKSGAMDTLGERGHMLANMERMAGYLREVEHKTSTKQMDMFDLGEDITGSGLILDSASPMSFEDKIREERNAIGMSISGDPLDGLKRYIERKSLGLDKVREVLSLLEESITEEVMLDEEITETPEEITETKDTETTPEEEVREENKKERKEKPIVQVIGYVDTVKKIQTKKGDNMVIATCSSTGWKFTIIVFPKMYDQIAHLIKTGEIVLVKGKLSYKAEMREISIEADQVKRSTIGDLRTAARNEKIFGDSEDTEEEKELFPEIQKNYTCIMEDKILTIILPETVSREKLLEIKSLLEGYKPGEYHVWLKIGEKMIDTKREI